MPLPPGKDEWQMPYPSGTENWQIPHPIPGGTLMDSLDTSIRKHISNSKKVKIEVQFCNSEYVFKRHGRFILIYNN